MGIRLRALDPQYLGAFAAASPDEMRLLAVLRVLMAPSYAPSRIHLNGRKTQWSSPTKELARLPGVLRKSVNARVIHSDASTIPELQWITYKDSVLY